MLPQRVVAELRDYLVGVQRQRQRGLRRGFGAVNRPLRWSVNIRMLTKNEFGNIYFHPVQRPKIHAVS